MECTQICHLEVHVACLRVSGPMRLGKDHPGRTELTRGSSHDSGDEYRMGMCIRAQAFGTKDRRVEIKVELTWLAADCNASCLCNFCVACSAMQLCETM